MQCSRFYLIVPTGWIHVIVYAQHATCILISEKVDIQDALKRTGSFSFLFSMCSESIAPCI